MDFLTDHLAVFMIVALGVLLFSGYPVALVLAGVGLGFALIGHALGVFPLVAYWNIPVRIYGLVGESLIYPAVPMLLFMSVALEKSGIARELLLCLHVLLRRLPGSLAVAVTVVGIVLAPSAGLIGASVATLALIGLPTMLDRGYRASYACGSVAAAGTLGLVLPPAVMLFFLADLLDVRLGYMFLAPLFPGLLLALLFVAYYVGAAAIDPTIAPPATPAAMRGRGELAIYAVRSLALPVLLIALVLGSIGTAWATPTESASIGAAGALLLMVLNRSFSLRLLHAVIQGTAQLTAMVFFIVIGATAFSYVFRYLGGDEIFSDFLRGLGLGNWGILTVVLATIFLLGFFIDWIEIALITLPIFSPLLKATDFSGYVGSPDMAFVWIAVLIALVLQTSFLTPPFGFALFFLRATAPPSVRYADIYRGIVPVVALQLLGLGLVMALPWLATWLPLKLAQ